jgi:adenosylcobinamide-GDP ribazoletransferase
MTARAPFWAPPLLALQFLTRVPTPYLAGLSPEAVKDGLTRAVGWFPLVGTLVGLSTALVLVAADALWPRAVAVILALVVEARLTGAFHEDAVADFCDAFGGGHDAESIHRIMKDSRIGSFGAVGLGLALALRAALLVALEPALLAAAIMASATFGRSLIVAAMAAIPPAPVPGGLAKDIGGSVGMRHLVWGAFVSLPGLAAFALLAPVALAAALAAAALFLLWFAAMLRRRLGGSTGDCLGFVAYAGQLLLLLAATAA